VQRAGLSGDVGFAVVDVKTGAVLETRLGSKPLPPASTLKTVTALYALDRLGPQYRFRTQVLVTAPVRNGRVDGDLILVGGGDPTLDTDGLADLAVLVREAGIHEVTGAFRVYAGALPRGDRIDSDQPEHVSYNPAYGGMNLNFNRVHFEWKRRQDSYEITMQARATRFRPSTSVASMSVVDRKTPVFDHWSNGSRDNWSVARFALGRDGARWLPVRYPALYAGDVFRTLARSNGLVLPPAKIAETLPPGTLVAEISSAPLKPMLQDMLKYSTNLTAEVSGLTASAAYSEVPSLDLSAWRMSVFARSRGAGAVKFFDHSGLNYDSGITPEGMTRLLAANAQLAPLLKSVNLSLAKSNPAPKGVAVHAKTGTLNFVSSLAGFIETQRGRTLAFAFLSADTAKRDAIPPAERERPPGVKAWGGRSRTLQKELIRGWAARYA
jgi:D-alanyl-D-alanine carboxypeptidase/D-alanyl-D-alanine-endopeptidase (penicillin-binding protein 4)